ncbi:MAG: DUF4468 domain-containing protein [Bacteroidaceae bacterium]|nr:DUF4468 domain-containing protein [Bacteroidaceae bacterium]
MSHLLSNYQKYLRSLSLFLFFLPLLAFAGNEDPKYLAGAVPEVNGVVTFTQTFSVPGKSQTEIYGVMNAYIRQLMADARQDIRTRMVSQEPSTGEVVAKVEEIMTFKKRFLNWDHTYFRYLISAQCTPDSKVTLTITQISYLYGFDQEGNGGEHYRAEEWITDREAINKKGTKLYPRSGKFRRKTVDRVEKIFLGARMAFEEPQPARPAATVVE